MEDIVQEMRENALSHLINSSMKQLSDIIKKLSYDKGTSAMKNCAILIKYYNARKRIGKNNGFNS